MVLTRVLQLIEGSPDGSAFTPTHMSSSGLKTDPGSDPRGSGTLSVRNRCLAHDFFFPDAFSDNS